MYIDSIENGIVLDHITAGRGMRVYETLGLDALDCTVAILKNVPSGKMKKRTSSRSARRSRWTVSILTRSAMWIPASPSIVSRAANVWKSGTCPDRRYSVA